MEFEEMKKIWDTQNNEPFYGINESALHNLIQKKKKQAMHITHLSELMFIIVYAGGGCFIIAMNILNRSNNIFMYILAAWMICSAAYILLLRIRRLKGNRLFDRSMLGDLDYAVSVATYQVHISQLMRWNMLPVALLTTLGVWEGGKSFWIVAGLLVFFGLTAYASKWEHNMYKNKKRELKILQQKLDNE